VPELDEIVRKALEDRILDLHTSMPGRVTAVHSDGTADVKPTIRRPVPATDGGFVYEEIPVIPHALVCAFGTPSAFVAGTLTTGDFVWLLFPEADIGDFLDSGSDTEPKQVSRHQMACPLAIPICLPGKAVTSDFVARASQTDARLSALENWANQHTHATAALGPPVAGVPALVPGGLGASTASAGVQLK
jgi:hypothetical protein